MLAGCDEARARWPGRFVERLCEDLPGAVGRSPCGPSGSDADPGRLASELKAVLARPNASHVNPPRPVVMGERVVGWLWGRTRTADGA